MTRPRGSVWLLFLEVGKSGANGGDAAGAFVWAAALAPDQTRAVDRAARALEAVDFCVVRVEDASELKRLPAARRRLRLVVGLARRARRSRSVAFSPFYTWPRHAGDDPPGSSAGA